ncbi:MAG: hypothetical protein C3F13_11140 [Anaerolineales bacterium]|nr:MAG: hypothetical protein C3F13_11140 [Anaerolineales bacterium]
MKTIKSTTGLDPKIKLSLLWIFVLLNMAYADILSLMDPTSAIREVMGGAPLPSGGLVLGAIIMETAIAMVILSWVLNYKIIRWVTSIIAAINIFGVVTGGHGPYYVFFATVEVACMLLIIWFAWKWKPVVEPI